MTKSAANKLLPQLVRSAVSILRDQLDGLMWQFKDANSNFCNAYFAARRIVANRGGRAQRASTQANPVPAATPTATPLAKVE